MPHLSLRYGLLVAAGCSWLVVGCQHAPSEPALASAKPTPKPLLLRAASLVEVAPRPWQTVIRSQGGLIADEATTIGAKVAGRVASVAVDIGDFVREGDIIAQLDDIELKLRVQQAEAQLAQARAAVGLTPDKADDAVQRENSPVVRQEKAVLEEARANLARLRRLEERNAVTQADLDTSAAAVGVAEARYASSLNAVEEKLALIRVQRAQLLLAQDMLNHSTIRAPYDGLIQERQTAAGAYLNVGSSVATLVRIDPLRYRGIVPERYALNLRPGQKVLVHLDGLPEPITTRISRISPEVEEMSRALTFEADLPNPDGRLRSGLFAEADVVIDTQATTLAVPASSVVEFAGIEKVWRVKDGEAAEVEVRTGRRENDLIEIVSGLSTGDQVIHQASEGRSGPVQTLVEGEQVGG